MQKINVGDAVCHKSQTNIRWIVSQVENDLVSCTRLDIEGKSIRDSFAASELVPYKPPFRPRSTVI